MNEEEKKAIEYLKARLYGNEDCKYIDVAQEDLRIFIKLIEKLQGENEELKFKEKSRVIGKYGDIEIHDLINTILLNDYIPIQKAKDKFKRLEQLEKELLSKSIDESNEKSQTLKLSQTPLPEPQLPTKTICESFSKRRKIK